MSPAVAEALALVGRADLDDRCRGVARLAELDDDDATQALAGLLEEPSWYLRDRVVEALAKRPGAVSAIARALRAGSWFARASACAALGRLGEPAAVPHLLEPLEDRSVSVQKSAVEALERLARRGGDETVARALAGLAPTRRRRAVARIGHQAPAWADDLRDALAKLPEGAFAVAEEPAPAPAAIRGADVDSIVRFREFLAALPATGEDA